MPKYTKTSLRGAGVANGQIADIAPHVIVAEALPGEPFDPDQLVRAVSFCPTDAERVKATLSGGGGGSGSRDPQSLIRTPRFQKLMEEALVEDDSLRGTFKMLVESAERRAKKKHE